MRRPTTEVSAPLSTTKRYGPRPLILTSTFSLVLTSRAFKSSPPTASVLSNCAGGSGGMFGAVGGAGRGLEICGGSVVAATAASAEPAISASGKAASATGRKPEIGLSPRPDDSKTTPTLA